MEKALLSLGSVLAGIFAAVLVCLLIGLTGIDGPFSAFTSKSEYNPFILWSLILIPLGLMAGSFLTGFIGQPFVRKRTLNYLLLSPGLYVASVLFVYIILYTLSGTSLGGGLDIFLAVAGIIWILFSFAGTYLGFRIRAKKGLKPLSFDLKSDTTKS